MKKDILSVKVVVENGRTLTLVYFNGSEVSKNDKGSRLITGTTGETWGGIFSPSNDRKLIFGEQEKQFCIPSIGNPPIDLEGQVEYVSLWIEAVKKVREWVELVKAENGTNTLTYEL